MPTSWSSPARRATVDDLEWLRSRGIDVAITQRARAQAPILGICGGYQMLGDSIDDEVESGRGHREGLDLSSCVGRRSVPTRCSSRPRRALPTARWSRDTRSTTAWCSDWAGTLSSPTKVVASARWPARRGTDCSRTTVSDARS